MPEKETTIRHADVWEEDEQEQFKIIKEPKSSVDYHVYLAENVESNFNYVELNHLLNTAPKSSKVYLYLNNNGGFCDSGFQLVNSVKDSDAEVHVKVVGPCYSMGAILALCGTSLEMKPGTFLMFHNYSGGHRGKGGEMVDAAVHYRDYFNRHMPVVCRPFLTEAEVSRIINDKDLYVDADSKSLPLRLKRHFE